MLIFTRFTCFTRKACSCEMSSLLSGTMLWFYVFTEASNYVFHIKIISGVFFSKEIVCVNVEHTQNVAFLSEKTLIKYVYLHTNCLLHFGMLLYFQYAFYLVWCFIVVHICSDSCSLYCCTHNSFILQILFVCLFFPLVYCFLWTIYS